MSETNGHAIQAYEDVLRLYQTALQSRAQLAAHLGKAFGGDRDYYSVLGYDRTLDTEKYKGRYDRQDIASRIVRAYPEETWRVAPRIYEDDTEVNTPFEQALAMMAKRLRLFHYFYRADVLACLGRYSVIFLGFDDVTEASQLAQPVSRQGERRINYLSVYSEENASILSLDENVRSPRFGMPLVYDIDFNRKGAHSRASRRQLRQPQTPVHHDRVIHIADGVLEDDIYGKPKLESVYNLLDDLMKVVGGGSEIFWRSAQRDLIIEVNQDAHLSPDDKAALTDRTDEYIHGLKRFLGLENATAKSLPVDMFSPKDNFDIIMDLIAGAIGIPKRVLIGSERGELASSQDDANWANRNATRQAQFAEPAIVRAFLDRCIAFRVLPTPRLGLDAYTVEWLPLQTESAADRAARARDTATAIDAYSRGLAPEIVPAPEFRELYLGLEPESPYLLDEVLDAEESAEDDEGDDASDEGDEPR